MKTSVTFKILFLLTALDSTKAFSGETAANSQQDLYARTEIGHIPSRLNGGADAKTKLQFSRYLGKNPKLKVTNYSSSSIIDAKLQFSRYLGKDSKLKVANHPSSSLGSTKAAAKNRWQGLYVGAEIGYASSKLSVDTFTPTTATSYSPIDGTYFANATNVNNVSNSGSGTLKDGKGFGGFLIGYNYLLESKNIIGVELQFNTYRGKDSQFKTTDYPGPAFTGLGLVPATRVEASLKNLALLSLKYGVLIQDSLVYVKAGTAGAKISFNTKFSDGAAEASNAESDYKLGWALGLGFEYPLQQGWSIKTEYMHADFGSISNTSRNLKEGSSTFLNQPLDTEVDATIDMINIGLNKHF